MLELLIVLAVFGILATIGAVMLLHYRDTVALKQAAAQVATDLEHARSLARRSSLDQAFSAVDGAHTYTITSQASAPMTRTYTLPSGVTFVQGRDISFTAPYGTTSAVPKGLELQNRGGEMDVNVLGIGGKVVVRAP